MGNLLFSPSGRIGPADFMKGAYVLIAISFIMGLLPLISFGLSMLSIPVSLVMLYCWVALFIKRFHDGGKTGWMVFLPILAIFILGYFLNQFVSNMVAGDVMAQAQKAAEEAAAAGDISGAMQAGMAAAKKTAIPTAIAGAILSFIVAFGFNKWIKHDDHDNQYGPA